MFDAFLEIFKFHCWFLDFLWMNDITATNALSTENRYPTMSEDDIEEACPFCRGNCNCHACLRRTGTVKISLRL